MHTCVCWGTITKKISTSQRQENELITCFPLTEILWFCAANVENMLGLSLSLLYITSTWSYLHLFRLTSCVFIYSTWYIDVWHSNYIVLKLFRPMYVAVILHYYGFIYSVFLISTLRYWVPNNQMKYSHSDHKL